MQPSHYPNPPPLGLGAQFRLVGGRGSPPEPVISKSFKKCTLAARDSDIGNAAESLPSSRTHACSQAPPLCESARWPRQAPRTTWRGGQRHSWTFIALQGPDLQEVLATAIQLCPWLEKPAGDWGLQGEEELHWEKMLTELNVERKDKGLDEGALLSREAF